MRLKIKEKAMRIGSRVQKGAKFQNFKSTPFKERLKFTAQAVLLSALFATSATAEIDDLRKGCATGSEMDCKKLNRVINELQRNCDAGGEENALDCANLGYAYDSNRSFKQAARYYDRACKLGEQKGCVYLGLLYNDGQGVAQDRKRANELFSDACKKNSSEGCASLAYNYKKGLGVYPDVKKAIELLIKACKMGQVEACHNLGLSYVLGDSVKKDADRARTFFTRACEQGHVDSCVNLGVMYFKGDGGQKDHALAAKYFSEACEKSDEPLACSNLAYQYEKGWGVAKDKKRARELYEKACKLGRFDACEHLKAMR